MCVSQCLAVLRWASRGERVVTWERVIVGALMKEIGTADIRNAAAFAMVVRTVGLAAHFLPVVLQMSRVDGRKSWLGKWLAPPDGERMANESK